MIDKLSAKLDKLKEENQDASVEYQLYGGDNTPLIISIVTLLMKCIHKCVLQSGDLMFVDSTSNIEEHNLKGKVRLQDNLSSNKRLYHSYLPC